MERIRLLANPNPSPATRFKPGANWTGNRLGRPAGESFASALRVALESEHQHDSTWRRALVVKAVRMAAAGDLEAMKWIADRTDGKVADKTQSEHSGVIRVEVEYVHTPETPGAAPGPGSDQT